MFRLRPIAALVLGTALLSACGVSPVKHQWTDKAELTVKPVVEIQHSGGDSAFAHYERGRYFQSQGNLDLAMEAYVQALKLEGGHVEARSAMASIYASQGKLAEAESALSPAVTRNPNAAYLRNNLGYIYHLQGKHEAAIKEFRAAIALDPKNEWARNNLASATKALVANIEEESEYSQIPPMRAASAVAPFEVWGQAGLSDIKSGAGVTAHALPMPELVNPILPVQVAATNARREFRLEISNGNGVTGMAKQMSQILGRKGIPVHRLTNQEYFGQLNTQIQYREGFELEAMKLKESLRGYAIVARADKPQQLIDICIILGKDIITHIAEIEREEPVRVAIMKPAI